MTDQQLSEHLGQLLRKYPTLRTEIEQSVVRDTRAEMLARRMVECSVDDRDWNGDEDEIAEALHDDSNGLG